MKKHFTVNPKGIMAAETVSTEDPRMDIIEELQDKVEDDFSYVMSGIERLVRENMIDEATQLLNTLSDTLNSAVGIIGNNFDNSSVE